MGPQRARRMAAVLLAAAVFVLTYVLIAVRRFRSVDVPRGLAALAGAALMLVLGIVTPAEALASVDVGVLLLLVGMMMLVAGLEYCGLFSLISDMLVRRARSRRGLLALVMCVSAALSAVALNDAVVLLFTPVVIRCCRSIGCTPVPYLVGTMVSANIGSMCTIVGNPQNAYIASMAGIDFVTFSMYLVPVTLVCMPVAFAVVYAVFRKRLDEPYPADAVCGAASDGRAVDTPRLKAVAAVFLAALALFAASGPLGIPIHVVAVCAGAGALAVIMAASPRNILWMAGRIDWSVILFFAGLFVLMAGVTQSGLLEAIACSFPGFRPGETPSLTGVMVFSAVLSNLVSNVPSVMLIGGMIPAGGTGLWIALASSAALAGNATILGSAASIIVCERSERYGITLDFFRFLAMGVPLAVLTLLLTAGMLTLMFG